MNMIEYSKMLEELKEVANKYGLSVDGCAGTIGEETDITLLLRTAVKNENKRVLSKKNKNTQKG